MSLFLGYRLLFMVAYVGSTAFNSDPESSSLPSESVSSSSSSPYSKDTTNKLTNANQFTQKFLFCT